MRDFRKMVVWQRSFAFVKQVYQVTALLPKMESFVLVQQINKCAISIPSNIAEGSGRTSERDFGHFLSMALGSSFELETQLLLTSELGYVSNDYINSMICELHEIQKMIVALKKKLK